jgi:hypothetical protein
MAGTSYKIRGIEPPDLAGYPPETRKLYWSWVVELGLAAKGREILAGLDKDGKPLKPITEETRKHRKSAMTPSGKGAPAAPALIPGWQKSRTYSLLAGRALSTHAEFYWRYDAFTGDSWGQVLAYQAKQGRDVIGISATAVAKVKVQSWARWASWKSGTYRSPAVAAGRSVAAVPQVGRRDLSQATVGVSASGRPVSSATFDQGQWSGGMTPAEWASYYRQTAPASLPGRPANPRSRSRISGPQYNRLIAATYPYPTGSQPPPASAVAYSLWPLRRRSAPTPARRPIVPPDSGDQSLALFPFGRKGKAKPPEIKWIEPAAPTGPLKPNGEKPSAIMDTTRAGAVVGKAADKALEVADKVHGLPARPPLRVLEFTDGGEHEKAQAAFKYDSGTPPRARSVEVRETADDPHLTFLHELGHYIEKFMLPENPTAKRDWFAHNSIMNGWKKAVGESASVQQLDAKRKPLGFLRSLVTPREHVEEHKEFVDYSLRYEELWARSYCQYIAHRSNDPTLKAELRRMRDPVEQLGYDCLQWGDDDFEPIAKEIDKLFAQMGWLK